MPGMNWGREFQGARKEMGEMNKGLTRAQEQRGLLETRLQRLEQAQQGIETAPSAGAAKKGTKRATKKSHHKKTD